MQLYEEHHLPFCPVDNNCLTKSIVYEATISWDLQNYEPKKYIGFKKRFTDHKSSLKDTNIIRFPNITWRIIPKEKPYTP